MAAEPPPLNPKIAIQYGEILIITTLPRRCIRSILLFLLNPSRRNLEHSFDTLIFHITFNFSLILILFYPSATA